MSTRRAALLATLLLASLAAVLGFALPARAAGGGGGGTPTPLPPDQATALATATAADSSGSSTSAVDGATALNAASLPEADTTIESGVTAQEAVGLAPLFEGNILSATKPVCWASVAWRRWGTWPYEQKISDTTYWCAVYGSHITFRTATTTASGTLCGVSWRAMALVGGGIGRGFTYFTNRASAGFSCQTIVPWVTIHTSHHEDTQRTDLGKTNSLGYG
ncbi:MAG TPA: hypothetical protein VKB43_13970 [Gaiellaceae bacterium]|nr:hypothetical protein [Gaiellaceae bacterium]